MLRVGFLRAGGVCRRTPAFIVGPPPVRSYRVSHVCRASAASPPPPPKDSSSGTGKASIADATAPTSAFTAKQLAMREEATKQFFARQSQKARPNTAAPSPPPPQSQEPVGYGASASPLSASDDMDSSFAISRKGLLKNAKPFYQIDPAPADVIKSPRTPLLDDLYSQIKVKGPLTVADYMSMCLGHPLKGYYMNREHAGRIFGRSGDFVTNPEVSSLFSEILCVWVVSIWEQAGKPKKLHLVELGPGRGTMMHDILAASRWFQEFQITVRVHLVENSPILREAQYWTIIDSKDPTKYGGGENPKPVTTARRPSKADAAKTSTNDSSSSSSSSSTASSERKPPIDLHTQNKAVWAETKYGIPVEWHWTTASLPADAPLVVLAHEFFDALPIHQFQYTSRGWCERLVDIDNESGPHHLRWVLSPGPSLSSWHYMMKRDTDTAFTPLKPSSPAAAAASLDLSNLETASPVPAGASMPFAPPKNALPKFDIRTPGTSANGNATSTPTPTSAATSSDSAATSFASVVKSSVSRAAASLFGRSSTDTAGAATDAASKSANPTAATSSLSADEKAALTRLEQSERQMVQRLIAEKPIVQDTIEVGAVGMSIMEDLTLRIGRQGGAALVIDYGADHPLPRSLQGIKKHARADILSEPGEVDLSAHVNFNALRRTALIAKPKGSESAKPTPAVTPTKPTLSDVEAEEEGRLVTAMNKASAIAAATDAAADTMNPQALKSAATHPLAAASAPVDPTPEVLAAGVNPVVPIRVFPVITQREFLREMGIQERLKFVLDRAKSDAEYDAIMSGFNRLIGDDDSIAMGNLFKVMTIAHTKVGTPYGFHLAADRQQQEQLQQPLPTATATATANKTPATPATPASNK